MSREGRSDEVPLLAALFNVGRELLVIRLGDARSRRADGLRLRVIEEDEPGSGSGALSLLPLALPRKWVEPCGLSVSPRDRRLRL